MTNDYCSCASEPWPGGAWPDDCDYCQRKARERQAQGDGEMTEACAFCRVGSCAIHGVLRFVAPPGRKTEATPDEDMAPIGCCDDMTAAYEHGLVRMSGGQLVMSRHGQTWKVVRCPFCRAVDS